MLDDLLDDLAYAQVMPVVLVPHDVTPGHAGTGQKIEQFLLLECQVLPARNPVAQYPDVGETVGFIDKVVFRRRFGCHLLSGGSGGCILYRVSSVC